MIMYAAVIPDVGAYDYLIFLIRRGGLRAGIDLRPSPKAGTEEAGEWTYRFFSDGKGRETIVLNYWKGPHQCERDEFLLQFPETPDEQESFSNEIATRLKALSEKYGGYH